MFLAIGVSDSEERLEYEEGLMTYYVRTTCCNSVYELDPEVGEAIENGERVIIRERDLHILGKGRAHKKCGYCGYETAEDFEYCPKCGNKL